MLINKSNIKLLTQFTLNIEDRIFNPNISDAQEYDLRPTVGDLMMDKLLADFPNGVADWNVLTIYNVGDLVVLDGFVYKSLTINVGQDPSLFPADWELNELGLFYYNFLIPYLVFASYGRFLLWIGTNLTQYGLREINEETSIAVSDQRRAELITDIKQKMNIWYSRLRTELCRVNYVFDSVDYQDLNLNYNPNPRKTFKIRPVDKFIRPLLKNNQGPIR